MGRDLIIVESPAKARTIQRFVGRRFRVLASMGHVRDLPKSKFGVKVESGFEPEYIDIRGKGKVIRELRAAAGDAGRVLLATDPDREGEAISWHLAHILDIDPDRDCRVVFHEVTADALKAALEQLRPIDLHLVNAQQARRILDRVVGYRLSPLLWRKVRRGLSAGRVQSVAVRLVCDRQAEIDAFKREEYWTIAARLRRREADGGGAPFCATYHGRGGKRAELKAEGQATAVVDAVKGESFSVVKVQRRERLRNPAPPFTTSTMQQEASRKLGFTVRRTMAVAQQLYEGLKLGDEGPVGLITYMRTDSTRIADVAMAQAAAYVKGRWGATFAQPRRFEPKKTARVQGAHEAVRPTLVSRAPDAVRGALNPDQFRLYRLIWERFVSSQMKAAVLDTVAVDIAAGEHLFRATGSQVKFQGFMVLYTEGRDEEEQPEEGLLPDLAPKDHLELLELTPAQHFTEPPPAYSEAMLVKALEEKGIGRPSTYAPTIETIQQRNYVVKEDRRFHPTALGRLVVDLLKEHFPEVVDVQFTAQMEDRLDRIEDGAADWQAVVGDFYGPFQERVQRADTAIVRQKLPEEVTDQKCDLCGKNLVIKYGRYGRFLACPGFPDCRFTKPVVKETGVMCPACGKSIVERTSRRGRRFYGCSGYPACRFVSWQRPVAGKSCPECGSFLVARRGEAGLEYHCSKEGCGFTERARRGRGGRAAAATAATPAGPGEPVTPGEPVAASSPAPAAKAGKATARTRKAPAKAGAAGKARAKAGAGTKAGAAAKAGTKPRAKAGAGTKAGAAAKAGTKPRAKAGAGTKAGVATKAGTKPRAKAGAKTAGKAPARKAGTKAPARKAGTRAPARKAARRPATPRRGGGGRRAS